MSGKTSKTRSSRSSHREVTAGGERREQADSTGLLRLIKLASSETLLERLLAQAADLLAAQTGSLGCLIYLLEADQLVLRAASGVHARYVGQIAFGVSQGIAGWALRQRSAAYVPDEALSDPRAKFVVEINEGLRSVLAVPLIGRGEAREGVLVLHLAPGLALGRESTRFLEHAALLLAGAVASDRLLKHAEGRVRALGGLVELGEGLAAAEERSELGRAATEAARRVVPSVAALLFIANDEGAYDLAAVDPPDFGIATLADATAPDDLLVAILGGAVGGARTASAPISANGAATGFLALVDPSREGDEVSDLLRAAASQVGLALERVDLIRRLTTEQRGRRAQEAVARGDATVAGALARDQGVELSLGYAIVVAERRPEERRLWSALGAEFEQRLRRAWPPGFADLQPERVTAILSADSEAAMAGIRETVRAVADTTHMNAGISRCHADPAAGPTALREALDSCRIAHLLPNVSALSYDEIGAFRYLVRMNAADLPRDRYTEAVAILAGYDARRRGDLLHTLEIFLENRGAPSAAATTLHIHVNTLRQRLDRIEKLTGLRLADEDHLGLELAIKVNLLRGAPSQSV